jgi:hypothetical protein
MSVRGFPPVPASAWALDLFRILGKDKPRQYTATTFPQNPYQGCERMIRMARAVGWIGGDYKDSYGLLEVLDAAGDILCDYPVPNAHAFAQLKQKLDIAVQTDDA